MDVLQNKVCSECSKLLQPVPHFVRLAEFCSPCKDIVIEWFESEEE
jgi:hypothetical protein